VGFGVLVFSEPSAAGPPIDTAETSSSRARDILTTGRAKTLSIFHLCKLGVNGMAVMLPQCPQSHEGNLRTGNGLLLVEGNDYNPWELGMVVSLAWRN
jgi:hypothetical protein